jgi:hypothetical protein
MNWVVMTFNSYPKINLPIMQTARILQAALIMSIVAFAASCTAAKQYTGKLFAPRTEATRDSQQLAVRFLELDKLDPDKENWVSTDNIIRDVIGKDSSSAVPVVAEKTIPDEPLAKTNPQDGVRNKAKRD